MHSQATHSLLSMIRTELPIIQAPMAGISSPAMAAAVSTAGGLGSLGLGASTADDAGHLIRQVRERTDKSLNANVFVHQPAHANVEVETAWIERLRPHFEALGAEPPPRIKEIYKSFDSDDAMLAMLIAEKPRVVSFHFGLPDAQRMQALREAGIVMIASVTSGVEASQAVRAGVNAIVAQGWEAGGHRGVFDADAADDQMSTMTLVRGLVNAVPIPVIAAGGIMDGAGIKAALALGAAGAQLGTAFVATDESLADAGYREALFSDAAHHTVMTRAISGRPARSLRNLFTEFGLSVSPAEVPAYPIAYDLAKSLHTAGKAAGKFGYGSQWAGQGAPLVRKMSAASLVQTLASELP